ncbi:hypothetical protein GX51_02848 [Blastomyces parvus]|uniref:Sterigmatocystin biosynthesis P450 monooxygenase StcS n=1 Tax=Blastomyces parvus TaxID=2060905 RepID=A0A2B7XAL2_9EURO|nr:hypothetical protein GX51_02848 [Blastomyces parvus]
MSEHTHSTYSLGLTILVLVGVATVIVTFFAKLYRARMRLIDLRRRGLPVAPGHSLLFGHLLYFKRTLDRLPRDVHHQFGLATIAREQFYETGAFYIDLWPMSGLFFIVVSPKTGIEITQQNPKLTSNHPELLRRYLKPITGGPTILDMDEKEWKPWRGIFNKAFHSDRVMALVPGIVEEVLIYAETLRGLAETGEMCFLDPITLRFAIDIIGKSVLNSSLGAQRGYNALADGMLSQIQWHKPNSGINPFSRLNFLRHFIHWKNGRQMDRYIGAELDKRYAERRADPNGTNSKSVMDLVLQAYVDKSSPPPEKLDTNFRTFAIRQIRLFVFAGHDSTSTVICYCFHLLHKHPEVLAQLRAEHDKVLGPNIADAAIVIRENPHVVKSLQYTLAVIKESMRLFPPAGGTRAGKPGVNVTDDAGNVCPTDDAILWILHGEMQTSEKYWVKPDAFLPERWLVPRGHELYPSPGAWRPFEHGPRNCVAQTLTLVELRIILACLARTFEIVPAYDEWDAKHPVKGAKHYRGERAYLVQSGAAHPTAQYPCRVKLAK